ncbi:hypothetical protein AK812_SmicGene39094 [Symbiodinium microadriaticum]|uniref:Uncharacterized protein n=1 Tax=Symbiodinium microadriaticum TaxID=2951 RepID=A0A1Q9CC23_SYMMI|nr:hypothetical protein AK812_SmicGene39094 [Symbiodinium microadriaticum]CAE7459201.1 unnamed protein product [Symbiodinium sp. KB8]CAE7472130.1 unnamed protein product [Symbiodinium microadriaticum]
MLSRPLGVFGALSAFGALVPLPARAGKTAWINSGTPEGVPEEYDCTIRELVWQQGQKLLPARGSFRSLFEAMQLQNCNRTTPSEEDRWQPPRYPAPSDAIFVDGRGQDHHPGTLQLPVRSLHAALEIAAGLSSKPVIVLREGTYYVNATLQISKEKFIQGLQIQNYPGEHAVLSGGRPLNIPKAAWSNVRKETGWRRYTGWNNIFGLVPKPKQSTDCCLFLGTFQSLQDCENAAADHSSYVWHESADPAWLHTCYGMKEPFGFHPVSQNGTVTGRRMMTNLWRADLSALDLDIGPEGFPGLRLNGERAIRAKYPDGAPEHTGQWLYGAGQSMGGGDYVNAFIRDGFTSWTPPRQRSLSRDMAVSSSDWPGVEWPMTSPDGSKIWTGEGDFGKFYIGVGGTCDDVKPSAGYWCGAHPPRGSMTHNSPSGIDKASKVLPHFQNYTSLSTKPVINAWRGGGRWFSWQFLVDEVRGESMVFSAHRGGNQGGEGVKTGGQWWIENVLEECDAPNEFFYDHESRMLYFSFNGTNTEPDGSEQWVLPVTQVLLNITSSDSSLRGVEVRDSMLTYLEPHGLPSGGDWALERLAAIVIRDASNVTVADSLLTKLDGNGIFLDGAVKNASLTGNEFSYIGSSAMAAWGYTGDCLNANCSLTLPKGTLMGPDGRGMRAPHGTLVKSNLVREIGIWQKQSSMWFQAVTAETQLIGNVHFNGPRAGINFNDGFGGGDVIDGNVIGNCVRESGDHGPYNSWDRVPYITTLRTGRPSIIPKQRHITRNLWLGTYSTQEGVDTDDGSSYLLQDFNVFAYGMNGLKNDFGGHDNHQINNMYLFISRAWFAGTGLLPDGTGNNDAFTNNRCLLKVGGRYQSDCGHNAKGFITHDNTIYTKDGATKVCGGHDLNEYVRHSGLDHGSSVTVWPGVEELKASVNELLNGKAETPSTVFV